MEACEWLPPALAGRDSDVPAQDPYGLLPVGSRDRLPGNRGIDSRRRAQPHGGTRTPAVRPHRLRSKTQRSLCIYARFMQQRPFNGDLADRPWDKARAIYFCSYTLWESLTIPF